MTVMERGLPIPCFVMTIALPIPIAANKEQQL